jgi:phosphonatase-like hydrolase
MRFSRRSSLKALAVMAVSQNKTPAAESSGVRLVVLDVGGTIIQDRGDVPVALQAAFEKHGLALEAAEIGAWRGASKREMVRHFVDLRTTGKGIDQSKLSDAVYRDFSARLAEAYATAQPVAGAERAFEAMRGAGFLLATTSGFDRDLTASIFHRLGWQKYFVASISGEDVTLGRPAPFMIFHAMEAARVGSVAETVAVGDTPLDLQAGSNAALRGVVGVLTGASTAARLKQEPHTHILESVAELPALLRAGFPVRIR